jgi:hypothetical protein
VRRTLAPSARVLDALAEKRATFTCVPTLRRPSRDIAPGLVAAGDYVAGPYPATLEGAVRTGIEAIDALGRSRAIRFRDAK